LAVSLVANVVLLRDSKARKSQFLELTYTHLTNIDKCLDNLSSEYSSDAGSRSYAMNALKYECSKLGDLANIAVIFVDARIDAGTIAQFVLLGDELSEWGSTNHLTETDRERIVFLQDAVRELMRRLSLHEKLIYSEFGEIEPASNNTINIELFNRRVEDFFKSIGYTD
jgi:hypothetical protein